MIHLQSVTLRPFLESDTGEFPFTVPVVRSLSGIEFTAPVTFFVGENGSGKSTVLEALACAVESITVGSESVKTDKTLAPIRKLARYFKLAWTKRTRKGFFMRAEDFFGYARSMRETREELEEEMKNVERDYKGRSKYAADLARSAYEGQLAAMKNRYGKDLDNFSHGEAFLTLFQARFVPGGLYLMDEPEAALSPSRQLSFLAAVRQMVGEEAQFVIATHSPILLAFPGAQILQFQDGTIREVKYNELEHVNLTRDFLANPDAFLRYL
ncbi:MAG: ATPase [Chloroflexi bacterium]|nr:ATPase [Chloroflexota bacterium]MDL1944403.1 ATP-binding cassette domain-containing protein [Chloroflexi bacterium CFX2]